MAVFRVEKNSNYTTISNYHLHDINLTLKAKGLLTYMLSLPDDWEYSINGLISGCRENRTAIRTALSELEENKYLKRECVNGEQGRFDYIYTVYELPYTENPYTENVLQLNTNIQNTNITNKKEIYKEKRFSKPTIEEIKEYITNHSYHIDAEQFFNFYESKNWFIGKSKMKDWKAAIRTWEGNRNKFNSNHNKKETIYNYDSSEDFMNEF